jgi:hypothetical protein
VLRALPIIAKGIDIMCIFRHCHNWHIPGNPQIKHTIREVAMFTPAVILLQSAVVSVPVFVLMLVKTIGTCLRKHRSSK